MNYLQLKINLPIPRSIRQIAQQFADEQPTDEKAKQVYLNTLAVYVVKDYLQMLGMVTDLSNCDSSNPIVRLCADIADLEIVDIGRIECRPLMAGELTCRIPPEVWDLRIAYVIVQIDESFKRASLLGFTSSVTQAELHISELLPLENLIDYLHDLKCLKTDSVCLQNWFDNLFEAGWESIETFFSAANLTPGFNFRSSQLSESKEEKPDIKRAKILDLGLQIAHQNMAVVVSLKAISPEQREISLQVYPINNQFYLPPGLQLIVLDQGGDVFMEAQARQADNCIQLCFSGIIGESFVVKVALGKSSILEHFTI